MKFTSSAPVRISLCNGGDTEYYVKAMKWSNLINTTLATHGYRCTVEEDVAKKNIVYIYKNTFSHKIAKYLINDVYTDKQEKIAIVTTTLREFAPEFRGTITIETNVPEKSGLGGSSSLVVSLLKALQAWRGKKHMPEMIARKAYEIERVILGIKGGYQDQWAASFGGGVNYLEFHKNSVFIEPLWLHEKLMKQIESWLLLFYMEPRLGDSGAAHEILSKRLKEKKKETLQIMNERRENVTKTREALLKGDFMKFAELLIEDNKKKQLLNPETTTSKSQQLYDLALKCGAVAGKISGAGKGGSALFLCPPKHQKKVIQMLESKGARHLPLKLQRLDSMGRN